MSEGYQLEGSLKSELEAWCQWLTPVVIFTIQEAEIRRITV
jgi:hypothetical protein